MGREIKRVSCLTKYPGYKVNFHGSSFSARIPGRGMEAFEVCFQPPISKGRKPVKIIDCNACIGLGTVNRMIVNHENLLVYEHIRQAQNAEELLKDMDFCGVEQSFVYHQAMFDTDPIYGNQLILNEAAKVAERLCATWTILPPITESFFESEHLISEMKRLNVRALRAYRAGIAIC